VRQKKNCRSTTLSFKNERKRFSHESITKKYYLYYILSVYILVSIKTQIQSYDNVLARHGRTPAPLPPRDQLPTSADLVPSHIRDRQLCPCPPYLVLIVYPHFIDPHRGPRHPAPAPLARGFPKRARARAPTPTRPLLSIYPGKRRPNSEAITPQSTLHSPLSRHRRSETCCAHL